MPNESTVTDQPSAPAKVKEVDSSNSSSLGSFEEMAVKELFGDQKPEVQEAEPLINKLHTEDQSDAAGQDLEVAKADSVQSDQSDDDSELVSMLKSNDIAAGNSERFAWVSPDASDKEIAEGIQTSASSENSVWQQKDVDSNHQFNSGDVVVFEQGGKTQVAYALTDFRGDTKFFRQNEEGEKRSYSSIKAAFPKLDDALKLKVFSPAQAGERSAAADTDDSKPVEKPVHTASLVDVTISKPDKTEPVKPAVENADEAEKPLVQPVELVEAPLKGRIEKTQIADDSARTNENLSNVISERQELLSQGKKPTDKIQVNKDGKVETMTVSQRLKELDAQILDSQQRPKESDAPVVVRLEIADPVRDLVREASDKFRVHDLVIKQSSEELTKLQESGKKPEDLTGRQIMKNGNLAPETVADRVKELKTTIRDELARSLETAERNSPGPLNPEVTRRLDVETANNTVERTQLMQKLGIMDPRLVNHENLARIKESKPESRADVDKLIEVVEYGNRIQDVRHGLAYTKLRSAEMKAVGYANPELGLHEAGNPNDVKSAFEDLTHARDIDSAVRQSQAGYEVEIMVASKVAPLLVSVEQGVKYSDLDNRFQHVEKKFMEAGMDNETRQNKELAQLKLAQEIEALLVLGDKDASEKDKDFAIEQLDQLSKNKIDGQSKAAQDVLAELTKAAEAGKDRDLSREEIAIRLAAEMSTQLDLGFLNAESQRDFFKMRGLDGSLVDPDDPNRRTPSFADRFAMMRDVGARAKLERARSLQDLTRKSDEILESFGEKYNGMSLTQVLDRTQNRNSNDYKLLKAVATRYYGSDENNYKNVSINDLVAKQQTESDEAALLMLEVRNEAPHLIYKVNDRGNVNYANDAIGDANFEATFGVSQKDAKAFAEAKRRYERVADGSTTTDKDGSKIYPHEEIQKMKDITAKMTQDVKRQKPILQARVKELLLQKEGLGQKSFTSEEARQMESERLQRQIDDLTSIMKERDESMKTQSGLTKFMDATHQFAQGNHDNVVSLLDEIKRESPEMYENEAFGMDEMRKNSDGWGGWFRRNWRTVAAVGAIAAGVVIGAATLGAGSPLSAALIGAGASTLTATAVGVGTFVAGTTAASSLIYSGTGRLATGEWNSDHAWEGAKHGLKTSAWMLAFYGGGALLAKGAESVTAATAAGSRVGWAARTGASVHNRLQNFKVPFKANPMDLRYAAAGTTLSAGQSGISIAQNWDKVGFDKEGMSYLKGEALQFGVNSLINTMGLRFMSGHQYMANSTWRGSGVGRAVLNGPRNWASARMPTTHTPFFSRATLGTTAANWGKFTVKSEMFNLVEDAGKKIASDIIIGTDFKALGGKDQPRMDWLADNSGMFRDGHTEVGGWREGLYRRFRPQQTVDWNDLQARHRYNANLLDSGHIRGLDLITNNGLLGTGNPLVFQKTPPMPIERKVWIPEVSTTPMKLTYSHDGKISSTPIVTDDSKAQGSKLQLRIDGLRGLDPHGLRTKRR